MSEERQLWAAVLEQAILDLGLDGQRDRATGWFRADHNAGIGSYLWICGELDLAPKKLRDGVFAKLFGPYKSFRRRGIGRKIVALNENGISRKKIASMLGCDMRLVHNALRKAKSKKGRNTCQ